MATTAREEPHGGAGRRLLVSPEEAASMLSVARSTVYVLMASGELRRVKIGKARRLRIEDIEAFVDRLAGAPRSTQRRGA